MKKQIKYLSHQLNNLFWFFYKLTPKGKTEFTLRQGFKGLQDHNRKTNLTKLNVVHSANKILKNKKILAFHKGNSITKSKKSNHQVIQSVKHQHQSELNKQSIKINKNGKFKTA